MCVCVCVYVCVKETIIHSFIVYRFPNNHYHYYLSLFPTLLNIVIYSLPHLHPSPVSIPCNGWKILKYNTFPLLLSSQKSNNFFSLTNHHKKPIIISLSKSLSTNFTLFSLPLDKQSYSWQLLWRTRPGHQEGSCCLRLCCREDKSSM